MQEIDRWALAELNEITRRVIDSYKSYDFTDVYQALYSFCDHRNVLPLFRHHQGPALHGGREVARSSFGTDCVARDRFAPGPSTAPILVFTADEMWERIPGAKSIAASVHLTEFPACDAAPGDERLRDRYARLFEIRARVMKALEDARNAKLIGSGLEARVTISIQMRRRTVTRVLWRRTTLSCHRLAG